MNASFAWMILPTALVALLGGAKAAMADAIAATPLRSSVVVQGQSGGGQASSCGSVAATPNYQIQVTQPFTALRFQVQAAPTSTLLVKSPSGQNHCVMADRYSGGSIEIPGLWEPGRYDVFVGEQGSGRNAFTLTIVQEQNQSN